MLISKAHVLNNYHGSPRTLLSTNDARETMLVTRLSALPPLLFHFHFSWHMYRDLEIKGLCYPQTALLKGAALILSEVCCLGT